MSNERTWPLVGLSDDLHSPVTVHVGCSIAFHKAVPLGRAVGASEAIPQGEILSVVVVEVEVVHGVA